MPSLPQRLFSNKYNATNQAESAGTDQGLENFRARLRLDLLTSRSIVIPDTHLFDGQVLLAEGPARVQEIVGGEPARELTRITIKSRAGTLAESLEELLFARTANRVDRSSLNPFRFKAFVGAQTGQSLAEAIADSSPAELQRHLRRNSHDVAAGVANFLRAAAGADAVEIDRLEDGWRQWIEADQRHKVTVERWDTTRQYGSLVAKAFQAGDLRSQLDPIAVPVFDEVLAILTSRRPAKAYLDHLLDDAASLDAGNPMLQGLKEIRDYHELARHRALAIQHAAAYMRSDEESEGRDALAVEADELEMGRPEVFDRFPSLPADTAAKLGRLDGSEYGAFYQSASGDLEKWWSGRDMDALRSAAAKLARQVEHASVSPPPPPWETALQYFGVLVLSGAVGAFETVRHLPRLSVGASTVAGALIGAFSVRSASSRAREVVRMKRQFVEVLLG